jgi:hypothetical protein
MEDPVKYADRTYERQAVVKWLYDKYPKDSNRYIQSLYSNREIKCMIKDWLAQNFQESYAPSGRMEYS